MDNFWNVIWVIVWSFILVAYLMVFFHILIDLFGDHELRPLRRPIAESPRPGHREALGESVSFRPATG